MTETKLPHGLMFVEKLRAAATGALERGGVNPDVAAAFMTHAADEIERLHDLYVTGRTSDLPIDGLLQNIRKAYVHAMAENGDEPPQMNTVQHGRRFVIEIAPEKTEAEPSTPTKWRPLKPQEVREHGVLQELNRQFLHPIGLALAVEVDGPDAPAKLTMFRTKDEDGIWFADSVDLHDLAQQFASLQRQRHADRFASLRYIVQPPHRVDSTTIGDVTVNVKKAPKPPHSVAEGMAAIVASHIKPKQGAYVTKRKESAGEHGQLYAVQDVSGAQARIVPVDADGVERPNEGLPDGSWAYVGDLDVMPSVVLDVAKRYSLFAKAPAAPAVKGVLFEVNGKIVEVGGESPTVFIQFDDWHVSDFDSADDVDVVGLGVSHDEARAAARCLFDDVTIAVMPRREP